MKRGRNGKVKSAVVGKKHQNYKEEVTINIGLYEWLEKDSKLKIKRGKRINLTVSSDDTRSAILIKAEQKWKNYHKNLYDKDDTYTLLCESGEVVDNLPGSEEQFI